MFHAVFSEPIRLVEQSIASPIVQFLEVVIGGILLGFCLARLTIWFITRINSEEMIQNSVIILSAYVTFILSQYYMAYPVSSL